MIIYILTQYFEYEGDDPYYATTNKKIAEWWCNNIERGSYQTHKLQDFLDFKNLPSLKNSRNKIKQLAEAQDSGIEVENIPERYKAKFKSFLSVNQYSVGGTLLKRFYCSECGFEDFDKKFAHVATYANGSTYRCPHCRQESSNVEEYDEE